RLVLGRARDQHLAQRADALSAPAAPPDLLDLVVEVGLVEHEVAKRLAGLEPRQRLEQRLLVVRRGRPRRRIGQLDRLAVGGADAEGNGFADVGLDSHAAMVRALPPLSRGTRRTPPQTLVRAAQGRAPAPRSAAAPSPAR